MVDKSTFPGDDHVDENSENNPLGLGDDDHSLTPGDDEPPAGFEGDIPGEEIFDIPDDSSGDSPDVAEGLETPVDESEEALFSDIPDMEGEPSEGIGDPLSGENDHDVPRWDESNELESLDDTSTYGDPNSVADAEQDVFSNDDQIPNYAALNSDIDAEDDFDDVEEDKGSLSGAMWALLAALGLAITALVAWLIMFLNTGETNPIDAVQNNGTSSTQTTTTPGASGSADSASRVEELESSLTSVIDQSNSATSQVSDLQSSIARGATDTQTITKSGSSTTRTVTSTSNRTQTQTQTRTQTRTDVRTRTVTSVSRAPAPAPRIVTRTETRNRDVPGPVRTVTKTVPTGRVTVTTTVIERWG